MTTTEAPSSTSSATAAEARGRYCPACRAEFTGEFLPGPGGRPDASCPTCMSLERERFLAILLDCLAPVLTKPHLLLDVAPSPRTTPLYKALTPERYVSLDFDPAADGRPVDVRASITNLPFETGTVDLMICYHVLEHVPDDLAAMREMSRVLARGGIALVQVPWRPGRPTDEDPAASREERVRRFGQADHVRYYGADFEQRMKSSALFTRRVTPADLLGLQACTWMRLNPSESVWVVQSARSDRPADALSALGSGALRESLNRLLTTVQAASEASGQEAAARRHAEQELTEARAALGRMRDDRDSWRARYQRTRDHWLLRSYLRLRRPVVRIIGRR